MKTVTGNTALVNDHTGLSGTGRYVRIYGTARGTQWGYSIWELEVYGTSSGGRLATRPDVIDLGESDEVSLYPMPVKNKLFIKGALMGSKFSMMNVSGIVVMEDVIKDEPIDLSNLASGFYIIDVNVNEHTKVRKKIIKED